jgi:hypothetical protein
VSFCTHILCVRPDKCHTYKRNVEVVFTLKDTGQYPLCCCHFGGLMFRIQLHRDITILYYLGFTSHLLLH